MIQIDIPVVVLKDLYSAVSSPAFDLTDVTLNIENDKLWANQRSPSGSTIIIYESILSIIGDIKDNKLSVSIAIIDLKTMSELCKDGNVTLELYDGYVISKVGKIKKTYPTPVDNNVPEKLPKFQTTNSFELTPEQLESINKTFSDTFIGDIQITVMDEIVSFSTSDRQRKNEIEFDFKELVNFHSDENVGKVGYDHNLFLPIISIRPRSVINKRTMEFGDGLPVKITLESPISKFTMFIGPIIYDD